jgi:hypothetical protein
VTDRLEFWKLNTVQEVSGLSKSEIYRRMREPGKNPFPPNHAYHGTGDTERAAKFWASCDVRAWQLAEIGIAPSPAPDWPSTQLGQPAPLLTVAGLLG